MDKQEKSILFSIIIKQLDKFVRLIFKKVRNEKLIKLSYKFNQNMPYIYKSNIDGAIELINIFNGKIIKEYIGHKHYIQCKIENCLFTFITGSFDNTIKLWHLINQTCLATINVNTNILCMVKIKNNKIAIGCNDKTIKIVNMNTEQIKSFNCHNNSVICLSIIKDYLISASLDLTVKIWSIKTMKWKETIQNNYPLNENCLLSLNNCLLYYSNKSLVIKDIYQDYNKQVKLDYIYSTTAIKIFKEDFLLVGNIIGQLILFDLKKETCVFVMKEHTNAIANIIVVNDNVITSSMDQTVIVWDVFKKCVIKTFYFNSYKIFS